MWLRLSPFLFAALLGCTGAISSLEDSPSPDPIGTPPSVPFSPLRASMQRLTQPQYIATVRAILGSDLPMPGELEADDTTSGLVSVGATLATISPLGVERYETAAFDLAAEAMERHGEELAGCGLASVPDGDEAACDAGLCPAEAGWTACGQEYERCEVVGEHELAYGADSRFVHGEVTGPFVCSNGILGDPAPGATKTCWVRTPRPSTAERPPPPSECVRDFVARFGRLFFRRPLTPEETSRYVALAERASTELDDRAAGYEYVLASFLQSPHFLFRVEIGDGPRVGSVRTYSRWEMASRLSFVLWNRGPDDALLDAAAAGELDSEAGLTREVDRMLASDDSRAGVRNFFDELLRTREVLEAAKSDEAFPGFDEPMRHAVREETLRLVEHWVLDRDGDYRDLFTTRTTFLNAPLAEHYDLEAGELDADHAQVELPEALGRNGLLGHASVLSTYSHSEQTSAALRGRFVRQALLCGHIPDPPPEVSTVFPPSDAPTLRERVEVHLSNEGCASCHALMDPIGLGLENFDAVGRYRETENGATIDPSGELDGDAFYDGADLGRAVADHPDLSECLTRSLLRYATGELESREQFEEIVRLNDAFVADGHRIRGLLRGVVLSRMFREVAEDEDHEEEEAR